MAEKPAAVQRLVRGDDGRVRVIFIDLKTLLEVFPAQLGAYEVINAGSSYFEPVKDVADPDTPSDTTKPEEINVNVPGGQNQDTESGNNTSKSPSRSAPNAVATSRTSTTPTSITAAPSLGTTETSPSKGVISEVSKGPSNEEADAVGSGPGPSVTGVGVGLGPGVGGPSGTSGPGVNTEAQSRHAPASIDYSGLAGKSRSAEPDAGFMAGIAEAVTGFFGPGYSVDVSSGKGSLAGLTGNANHPSGKAVDFGINDPSGKAISPEAMADFGAYAASRGVATGIGIGPGYMGPGNIAHMDVTHANPTGWGAKGLGINQDPGLNAAIESVDIGKHGKGVLSPGMVEHGLGLPGVAPAPTANPGVTTSPGITGIGTDDNDDSVAGGVVGKSLDISKSDVPSVAQAIAGEMGPASLEALGRGDPNAIAEVGQIATTMANRAEATGRGISGTLTPEAYNSLSSKNLGVTNQNYAQYGRAITQALEDAIAGKVDIPDPNATHYYNPSLVTPSWADDMNETVSIGGHTFGGIQGEFGYGKESKGPAETPGFDAPGQLGALSGDLGGAFGSVGAGAGRGSSMGGPSIGGQSGQSGFGAGSATGGYGGMGMGMSAGGPSAEGAPGTGAGYSGSDTGSGNGFGAGHNGPGGGSTNSGSGYSGNGGYGGGGGASAEGAPGTGAGYGGGTGGMGYGGPSAEGAPGSGAGYGGSGPGSGSSSGGVGYGEGGVGTSQSQGYGQAAESMGQAGIGGVGDTSDSGADFGGW